MEYDVKLLEWTDLNSATLDGIMVVLYSHAQKYLRSIDGPVTNEVRRGSIPCLPILSHAM